MKTIPVFALLVLSHLAASQSLLISAKEKGKQYGYIDERGNYIIAPAFDEAGPFYNGFAVIKKDKKYGLINQKGEMIIPPTYDKAIDYVPEGKITVQLNGKWGVIDTTGETIIPCQHDYLSVFKEGHILGGQILTYKYLKGRVCPIVLNEKADTVFRQEDCTDDPSFLPGRVDKKGNSSLGGWPMVRENKIILANSGEGNTLETGHPYIFHLSTKNTVRLEDLNVVDQYYGFRDGKLAVKNANAPPEEGFYVDSTGISSAFQYTRIFELNATAVHPFFNGVAAIEKDGKWSFIDGSGKVIGTTNLSTKEYRASPPMFFNGLIGFFNALDKVGYVDINGKIIIPFQFDEFHPFEYDITPVKFKGLFGLIRKDGTWAVQPKFEDLDLGPCPCYQ